MVEAAGRADELVAKALEAGVNIRRFDENRIGISVGESHGEELLKGLVRLWAAPWARQMHSTICPLSCCVLMSTCSTRFSTSTVPRPR